MFYIDHLDTKNHLYAVADTKDGVIDIISEAEYSDYKAQGIYICSWNEAKSYITTSMNRNCNYRLYRKLIRDCSDAAIYEYLSKYSVYTISQQLNLLGLMLDLNYCCKVFNYSQTMGYFLISVGLSNKTILLLKIDSEYNAVAVVTPVACHFESYPSVAGNFISRHLHSQGIDTGDILPNDAYAVLFVNNTNELVLVNQTRMGFLLKKLNKSGVF